MTTSVTPDKLITPKSLLGLVDQSYANAVDSLKALQDEDEISLLIENDPNLKLNLASPNQKSLNIIDLSTRDSDVSTRIDLCNKLWVLKGFIDQISTDLEMNEFESIFYNLNKLQSKLDEFEQKYASSVILDKVALKVYQFETVLESNIERLIKKQFWVIEENSIALHRSIEVNDYSELTYEELIDTLSNNYQSNHSQINKRLVNHLNVNLTIDEYLIQPLINDKFDLQLTTTETYNKLIKIPKVDSISNYIESLISCVNFINSIPKNRNLQNYIIKPILASLEKKLLEDNIELLISNADLREISLKLSRLLEANNWFPKNENLLQNWISDSVNYWIDKKFKNSLQYVRALKERLLNDPQVFSELFETKSEYSENANGISKSPDDKDGEAGDDDEWGAWDNDDEDLFDEKGELKEDEDTKERLQISKIPQICYEEIIFPFLNLSHLIKELNIEGMLILRLKDLLVDLFIVLSDLYQEKKYPLLFFNDFQQIMELTNVSEIRGSLEVQLNNFLELKINEYKFKFISIWNSTIRDFSELQDEDDDADEIFLIEFNDYIKNLNTLADLNFDINSKITNLFLISNHSFILEFLIKKIFSMPLISEAASMKISRFQISFIKIFKKTSKIQVKNVRYFNKFEKISVILNDNLRRIEASFNNGEFFDFETEELIRLIELLFVESDIRNELIDYIREVRSED